MLDEKLALLRAHRNNISRYRRLLKTNLTELARRFIDKRLSEEQAAMEDVAASTFPVSFKIPPPASVAGPLHEFAERSAGTPQAAR